MLSHHWYVNIFEFNVFMRNLHIEAPHPLEWIIKKLHANCYSYFSAKKSTGQGQNFQKKRGVLLKP